MLEDDVKKLEEALKRGPLDEAKRKEMLGVIGRLKAELERLAETHGEQARSIAGLAGAAAHEATRDERSAELLKQALSSLELSAAEFETSHPDLARTINDVSLMLSRIGI